MKLSGVSRRRISLLRDAFTLAISIEQEISSLSVNFTIRLQVYYCLIWHCPSYWSIQLQEGKLGFRCSSGLLEKPSCFSWDICRNNKMQKSLLLQAFFYEDADYLENRKNCVIWIIFAYEGSHVSHLHSLLYLICNYSQLLAISS